MATATWAFGQSLRHAFCAGAGVGNGGPIPPDVARRFVDYDPTDFPAYEKVADALARDAERRETNALMLAALREALAVLVQDDTPLIYAQVRRAIDKAEGRA